MRRILLLLTLLLLFNSCSEESITPAFNPQTLEEESISRGGDGAIKISLDIADLEVDEFGSEIGDVPVVGSVFQRLAGMFADISIDDENGTEVIIEPTYFEFPELEQVNFEYIKGVSLDNVHLKAANGDTDGVGLSFIKRIEVYLNINPEKPEDDTENEAGNRDKESILLLVYDKDRDTLGCLSKCLDMRVQRVDWREILKSASSFSIETKLVVDSVPKARIELGGEVKFSITVDLGF